MSLLAACLFAAAAAWAAPFEEGRAHYDAGRFAEAAAAFEGALQSAPGDARLHYNLGNARLKSGRLGPAVASYLRAFSLDPRDPDIRFNLDFALRQAGEELVPAGVPPALHRAFHALSSAELEGLFWLGAWLGLLLGGRRLLRPAPAGPPDWALAAALALAAAAGSWRALRWSAEPEALAVIAAGPAELRSGPGTGFSVAFTAPEGRRVRVLARSGDWIEVGVLKEGVKGWLPAGGVEPL